MTADYGRAMLSQCLEDLSLGVEPRKMVRVVPGGEDDDAAASSSSEGGGGAAARATPTTEAKVKIPDYPCFAYLPDVMGNVGDPKCGGCNCEGNCRDQPSRCPCMKKNGDRFIYNDGPGIFSNMERVSTDNCLKRFLNCHTF